MAFLIDNIMLVVLALVSGGLLLWPRLQGGSGGAARLAPTAVVQALNREQAQLLDVRDTAQFAAGHIAQARSVPLDTLATKLKSFNTARPVIIVAHDDRQARLALRACSQAGFKTVFWLGGGMTAWEQAGLPAVNTTATVRSLPRAALPKHSAS